MKKIVLVSVVLMVVGIVGCMTMPDGSLGVKPEVADVADTVADIGSTVAVAGAPLSVLWPPLSLILGIAGTIFGAWKNRSANTSHGVTEALVSALEKYKKTYPAEWDKLGDVIFKAVGPTTDNVIRAMRGLPPRV